MNMKIKIEQESSAWNNLSMRDRAKYIHNSVQNHFANGGSMTDISIDDIRHQFNDEGEKDIYTKANAILDERIKQKIMENRPLYEDWVNNERNKVTQAAFEYSNQRTSPSYIMQDNPYKTEEEWTSAMNSIIAERQKELNDSIKLNMNQPPMIQQMNISVAQQKLDDAIWEKNQGYSSKIPANSCLTTATDNYVQVTGDKSYGANLNSYFQNNHPGYEVVPGFENAALGDIVQLLEDNGEAKHGMIYAGQNDWGQYIFNNSAGGPDDVAYQKGISFHSINKDKNPNDHVQILRFIGNDKWNKDKEEDYNLRYPVFMQGGNLFQKGGPKEILEGKSSADLMRNDNIGFQQGYYPEVTIPKQSLYEAADNSGVTSIPLLGDAIDISKVMYDTTQGNYGQAALGAGLLLLPNVLEKPLKIGIKSFVSKLDWSPDNKDGDYLQYSDTSTYSGMTTDQIRDLQKQQIQTYQQAAQEGLDYTDKYYQSEGFKRRAAAQNFTGQPRLANPKLDPKKNIANSTATNIGLVSSTLANAKAKSVGLDAPYQQVPRYTDNPLMTAAHEAGHIKSPYERTIKNEDGSLSQTVMPQYFQDILKTGKVIKGQSVEHDSQIRERYSDLIGTRANLYKLGIFDSTDPNAVFTPQMYNEYKSKVGKMGDRFLEMFDQDNFIKAINDIAMNDVQNTESQYAANGGYLFGEGGSEDEQTLADGKVNYSYFLHPIDAFRYNGSPSYNTDIPFATAFTDAIRNNQENFQWGDNIYNTDIDWKHHFSKDEKGNNPFKEFAEIMYPAVIKVLQEQGLPIANAHNIVRQAAIESNYGTDPRGAQGYNLSGIKWTKSADPKYKHTTGADGEEYIDFDNLKDYIYYKVKILNDNYDALNAKNAKDFARRLHPNAAGIPTNQRASGYKGDYSGDYNSYKNNITNLNSLDKTLFHQMYKPLFGK